MKKITFIRHCLLEPPYNDYSRLTFNRISGLAIDRISPNIHPESQKLLLEKFDYKKLKSFDLILCSHSKRTKQTAELFRKFANKNQEIRVLPELSEISFNPKALTTQKEFIKQGLGVIRTSLFHGMKNGQGAESLDAVLLRAQKLKDELLELPFNNILCVTHSFYMRVLRLFFLEKLTKSCDISELKLINTTDHHYLEGFKVNI